MNKNNYNPELSYNVQKFQSAHDEKKFGEICLSGGGSSLLRTKFIIKNLSYVIQKYKIKTMCDVPCGCMNWMPTVIKNNNIDKYYGIEGSEISIQNCYKQIKEFNLKNAEIIKADMRDAEIPKVDLIFERDSVQHSSFFSVKLFLENILKSGSTYLLISNNSQRKRGNKDIKDGGMRRINLLNSPFNFPEPLETLDEQGENYSERKLGHKKWNLLYKLSALKNTIHNI
jgi:hypothetical protein